MQKFRLLGICFALSLAVSLLVANGSEFFRLYSNASSLRLPNGLPVGGDFVCFYLAGKVFKQAPDLLYDYNNQFAMQQQFFASSNVEIGFLPFIYPPLMAAAVSLLSGINFFNAFLIWLTFSVLVYIFAVLTICRDLSFSRSQSALAALIALSFPPFFIDCLAGGQTSFLGVLVFALAFHFFLQNRMFFMGLSLGLSYYKPPLFLVFILFLLLDRNWRAIAGFGVSAAVFTAASLLTIGSEEFLAYCNLALNYRHGAEMYPGFIHTPTKGAGILSTLLMILPNNNLSIGLFILIASLLLFFIWSYSRKTFYSQDPVEQKLSFALRLSASVLASSWLMLYDYSLLVPAIIIGASCLNKLPKQAGILVLVSSAGLFFEYLFREIAVSGLTLKPALLFFVLFVFSLILAVKKSSRHFTSA